MRQKRAKAYRKQMNVYRMTFKFKPPIQVLVDSDAILEAQKTKFDLNKGISRTIQMETKLFITQCCINHLYNSGNQEAIDIAKTMEKRRCRHDETKTSDDCISSITNIDGENKFRYVVVTQNAKLRRDLRRIPAVPLIYMNRSVMIMEPMSVATTRVVRAVERRKLTGGLNDAKSAGLKDEDEEADEEEGMVGKRTERKRKRGPKGPNPLSMKKKKKKASDSDKKEGNEQPEAAKKTRKRRHRKHGGANEVEGGQSGVNGDQEVNGGEKSEAGEKNETGKNAVEEEGEGEVKGDGGVTGEKSEKNVEDKAGEQNEETSSTEN